MISNLDISLLVLIIGYVQLNLTKLQNVMWYECRLQHSKEMVGMGSTICTTYEPGVFPNPMAFDPSRFQVSSYIQNYYSHIIYSYNQLLISPIILTWI